MAFISGNTASFEYVDRGDSTNWDFVQTDFIQDGVWHDLDLSSIIPEGTRVVHLLVLVRDDLVGSLF